MVSGLIDSAIVIDVLRGLPASQDWLSQQNDLGISIIVWYELLDGVKDKRNQMQC